MAGNGPPPKPAHTRRRRNASIALTPLPADGRRGDAPEWPLGPLPSRRYTLRERDIWVALWGTPQAVMWERQKYPRIVARYVRFIVSLEREFDPRMASEVRQLEDRLGLNPLALLRLRWEIPAKEEQQSTGPTPAAEPARRRLRVV